LKLMHKGASANIGGVRKLSVSMKWNSAADFDLAAVYEDRKGNPGIVYFGDTGNPNVFPHICGTDDCPDISGDNEENLLICRLDVLNHVWIMCWDYGKIQEGLPAEFKKGNLLLTITDDRGNTFDIHPDNDASANTVLIAAIDNTSPVGAKIINSSKTGMLNGLKKLDQLMDIIHGEQNPASSPSRIILE